ncbi:unnamed protein product, partial [Symbiodinium sp. CCMP2592]
MPSSSVDHEICILNDLQVAVEIDCSDGWQVVYPSGTLKVVSPTCLHGRVRDEPAIRQSRRPGLECRLKISECLQDLKARSDSWLVQQEHFIREEEEAGAQREKLLRRRAWHLRWRRFLYVVVCACAVGYMPPIGLSMALGAEDLCQKVAVGYAGSLCIGALTLGVALLVPRSAGSDQWASNICQRHVRCASLASMLERHYGAMYMAILLRMLELYGANYVFCFLLTTGFCTVTLYAGIIYFIFYHHDPVPSMLAFGPILGLVARSTLPGGVAAADAQLRAREQTIVFEGRVIRKHGQECVVSWPGKYSTAWDNLVGSAETGSTSAAVVFLPEGTPSYGKHCPIPDSEELDGSCWCFPIYGEEKPWGCLWWDQWMKNVEEAVSIGSELHVYFFTDSCGKGMVESFATAGQEHIRRDAIFKRVVEFEQSEKYTSAMAAGLGNLCQKKRYDSSSQFSREKHRLFLEWLPADDRDFLLKSEGLGNSQKAEVAWLQKRGYPYKEVDVKAWLTKPEPEVSRLGSERRDVETELTLLPYR